MLKNSWAAAFTKYIFQLYQRRKVPHGVQQQCRKPPEHTGQFVSVVGALFLNKMFSSTDEEPVGTDFIFCPVSDCPVYDQRHRVA
jgi:hypothetical protein